MNVIKFEFEYVKEKWEIYEKKMTRKILFNGEKYVIKKNTKSKTYFKANTSLSRIQWTEWSNYLFVDIVHWRKQIQMGLHFNYCK